MGFGELLDLNNVLNLARILFLVLSVNKKVRIYRNKTKFILGYNEKKVRG